MIDTSDTTCTLPRSPPSMRIKVTNSIVPSVAATTPNAASTTEKEIIQPDVISSSHGLGSVSEMSA